MRVFMPLQTLFYGSRTQLSTDACSTTRIIMVLLLLLLMHLALMDAQSYKFLGCYEDSVEAPSLYEFGTVFSDSAISASACVQWCYKHQDEPSRPLQFAGVQTNSTCFCAVQLADSVEKLPEGACNASCSVSMTEGETCGNERSDITQSVYELTGIAQPYIDVLNHSHISSQAVKFEFEPFLPGINYSFIYGDGSPPSSAQNNESREHIYHIPGNYAVQLEALSFEEAATANDVVIIGQDLDAVLQFNCPQALFPKELFTCNLTISSGVNLNLTVEYSSKHEQEMDVMELPDVYTTSVGIGVPQVEARDIQTQDLSSSSGQYYYMYESVVENAGIITGIELFGAKAGSVEILIMKRKSSDDGYCHIDQECDGKPMRTEIIPVGGDFEERSKVDVVEIKTGFNYFPFDKEKQVAVFPEDILAYKSNGGLVAYREALDNELADNVTFPLLGIGRKRHFLRAIIATPVEVDVNHVFSKTGNYTVTAKLQSNIQHVAVNESQSVALVQVALPLEGLAIIANKVAEPHKPVTFKATFTNGSDADVYWNFEDLTAPEGLEEANDDGMVASGLSKSDQYVHEHREGILTDQSIEATHIYSKQGKFKITVLAENVHNKLNVSGDVTVMAAVKEDEWAISPHQIQAIPPGRVNTTLFFTGNDYPSGMSVKFSWENKTQDEIIELNNGSTKEFTFFHDYSRAGLYTTDAKVYNEISEVQLNTTVEVVEKIMGLEIIPLYKTVGDVKFRRGYGRNKTTFPGNVTVKLETRRKQGTVDGFILRTEKAGGEKSQDLFCIADSDLFVNFSTIGNYTVYVFGSNTLEERSDPAIVHIYILDKISELRINDFDKVTDKNESKTFEIEYGGTEACILVDYGDDSKQEKYGDESICKGDFSRAVYRGPVEEFPLNVTHVYSKRGYYTFLVFAFDGEQSFEKNLSILVNYFPHEKPLVWIKTNSTDPRKPVVKKSSNRYKMETEAQISVGAKSLSTTWLVWPVNPEDGVPIEPKINYVNESFGPSWNKSFLYLNAGSLPTGLYKVIYNYEIVVEEMDPRYPVVASGFTYLSVVLSAIVPIIIKNNLMSIQRSYGDVIDMNPGRLSLDPDNLKDKNFTVRWYCRRIGESSTEASAGEEQEVLSTGNQWSSKKAKDSKKTKDSKNTNSKKTKEPKNTKSKKAKDPKKTKEQKAKDKVQEDKGGCFGNGPGPLKISTGRWKLDTSILYNKNTTYFVDVIVEKGDRSANRTLKIEVVPYQIPSVSINCALETTCRSTAEGLISVNRNERLVFNSRCPIHLCPQTATYKWKLFNVAGGSAEADPISNYEKYLLGVNRELVGVYFNFTEANSSIQVVDVTVDVTVDGAVGSAVIRVKMNLPPAEGSCYLFKKGTKALIDSFVVRCDNWIDPEDDGRLKYNIFASDVRGPNILVTSYETEFSLRLSPGKIKLWAVVADQKGGSTQQDITEVETFSVSKTIEPANVGIERVPGVNSSWKRQAAVSNGYIGYKEGLGNPPDLDGVIPPSQEELEEFTKSGDLSKEKATGDQYQMVQLLLAYDAVYEGMVLSEGTSEEGRKKESLHQSQFIEGSIQTLTKCNMDSLEDITLVTNTMSTILRKGDAVGRVAREDSVRVINNLYTTFQDPKIYDVDFDSPQQTKDFFSETMSVLGATTTSISNAVVNQNTLPVDFLTVNEIFYDTDIDDDPSFSIPSDKAGMEERAIREDARFQSKRQDKTINDIVHKLTTVVVKNLVPDEPPLVIDSLSGVRAVFVRTDENNTMDMKVEVGGATVAFPNYCQLLHQDDESCNVTSPITASVITWPSVLHAYGKNVDRLSKNTETVIINLFEGRQNRNRKVDVRNSSVEVEIIIPRKSDNGTSNWTYVVPKLKWFEYMTYHRVFVKYYDSPVNVNFSPENTNLTFALFVRYGKKPTLDLFDDLWITDFSNSTNETFTLFLSSETLQNRTGYFYFGIAELSAELNVTTVQDATSITKKMVNRDQRCDYEILIFISSCLFFNEMTESWETYGCRVAAADFRSTTCMCTHLTSFGSGFVVPPNPIDFDYVFANASFEDNLTIYMAIIVALAIYLLFLIWARHKDKKDLEKLGALPLEDNNETDKYLYEILVFTGHAKGSSTDSKVSFIVSGDKDETEIRTFGSPSRKVFRRDGADVFVMTTPRPLGQLQFLRIWHDSSGRGNYASWYLNYIMFRDVQTGEKFEFIANKWFALEKDDGQIDRVFPVADKVQLTEFSHLFQTTSRKKLTDGHLWFSIFLRPPRSRFTRCQRVSSCMAFLFLSMLVNAMWYGTTKDKPSLHSFKFGPFQLSPEQLAIGFFSNLIIFPPSFFVIFLFRKARPRHLRPSRITEAMKKQRTNFGSESTETEMETKGQPRIYKKERKFTLPWWCSWIAWLLCLACLLASVFFLWAYGIQFGNSKTKKWLTSLIISFFSSILITEPIKVFLLAMFMSALCKKVETDEDDADEDEEDPRLQSDEQWLYDSDLSKPRRPAFKAECDPEEVQRARQNRIKEVKMWDIIREITAYLMFLWILAVIGYGTRDPNGYYMFRTLKNAFANDKLMKIKTSYQFWNWASDGLMPNLRCQAYYNGRPPHGLKGFLNDKVNRIMGHAVMRQIRLKPGSCTPPAAVRNITKCSGTKAGLSNEDENNYFPGWNKDSKQVPRKVSSAVTKAFVHETGTFGMPYVGNLDVYSGGGYFYELRGNYFDILDDFKELNRLRWIDSRTRAVLVDFSVYNAQVNLFGVVTLSLEFIPGGGVIGDYDIEIIKLLQYEGNSGWFIVMCEIVYVLFILYYTVRELKQICKLGGKYFREYWNYAELAVIILSYVAIVMYVRKAFATHDALRTFNQTHGNKYINLQFCLFLHNSFSYILSFIVFISMMKFSKLLRFNKKISSLSSTLRQCANDLWGFGLVFLVFFGAFGQMFYLIFSKGVLNYATPLTTVESLFSVLLNKYHFEDYLHSVPVLGPLVFFSFAFFMNIILINLFLTIVIKSFETVKQDLTKQSNEYEIMEFVLKRFKSLLGIGRNRVDFKPKRKEESEAEKAANNLASEFPRKVDLLLQHINSVYFDGKMDLNSKEYLKPRQRKPNFNPHGDDFWDKQPQVYNSN